MSKDKKYELNQEQLEELIELSNRRATDVVGTFVSMIQMALEDYPDLNLRRFLLEQTVVFAGCIVEGNMVKIDDLEDFFGECSFDVDEVEFMLKIYEATMMLRLRLEAGQMPRKVR
jgi:hypothetical protein